MRNYSEFNARFGVKCVLRDFNEIEYKIYNTVPPINLKQVNCKNPKVLSALTVYFNVIEIDETKKMWCIEQLIKLGDSDGYFKLGVHYTDLEDYEKAIENFIKSGSNLSLLNLATLYIKQSDYETAKKYAAEAVLTMQPESHLLMAVCCVSLDDNEEGVSWLLKGIQAGCSKCLDMLKAMFDDNNVFYTYLFQMPNKPKIVVEKMTEMLPIIDMDTVDSMRDEIILLC